MLVKTMQHPLTNLQVNVTCQLEGIEIFCTQAIRKSLRASKLLLCCTQIRRWMKLGKFSYLPIHSIPRIKTVPPQDNNNNDDNNNNHLSQVSFYQATSVSINTTTVNRWSRDVCNQTGFQQIQPPIIAGYDELQGIQRNITCIASMLTKCCFWIMT